MPITSSVSPKPAVSSLSLKTASIEASSPDRLRTATGSNAETGDQRLADVETLELAPGVYTFRVTNTDVPYELGFWLREHDYQIGNPLHKLTKVSVSGGGLYQGQTKDYNVDLDPGVYLYSCPLNPTPNYKLIVRG